MFNPERRHHTKTRLNNPTAVIINNPSAGDSRKIGFYHRSLQSLQDVLNERLGLSVKLHTTENVHQAQDIVGEALAKKCGLLIVKGGDGTLAALADQLAEGNHRTHLLALGGGTQNILRGVITGHRDPLEIADAALCNGDPVRVDVGVIETASGRFPFLSNSGVGLDGHVLGEWEHSGRQSRAGILPIFFRERNRFKPYDMTVTAGGQSTTYEQTSAMTVINVGRYGGVLPLTDSSMVDGVLDGVVIPQRNLKNGKLVKLAWDTVTKRKRIDGLSYVSFREATITVPNREEIVFQHDGEPKRAGSSKVTITSLKQAITMWLPNGNRNPAFS